MSHHKTAYEDIIRAAGYRVTRQRVLILDAVCEAGKHTTLGETYARLRKVDSSIDISTLYRTLKLFIEIGLVVSAEMGDGETYYEIAVAQSHHHLVCRRCGKEQEIPSDVAQGVIKEIYARYAFRVEVSHLVLPGICKTCLEND